MPRCWKERIPCRSRSSTTRRRRARPIPRRPPVVDCIKITTSAVLDWDEFKGLPRIIIKKQVQQMFKKLFKSKGAVIWMSVHLRPPGRPHRGKRPHLPACSKRSSTSRSAAPRPSTPEGVTAMYPATESSSKEEAYQNANAMNVTPRRGGGSAQKREQCRCPSNRARRCPCSARTASTSLTAILGSSGRRTSPTQRNALPGAHRGGVRMQPRAGRIL